MSGFLVNSGQANACTGDQGRANCRETLNMAARTLGVPADELLPASTGVIGAQFDLAKWEAAMPALAENLETGTAELVARAIMTTDTVHKLAHASFEMPSGEVRLLGMCKGAGMISPNMATMLSFILCDADISAEAWQTMLADCVNLTINRITVDGDMSTNDCVMALANGASGVAIESEDDYVALRKHLLAVLEELAYKIVMDAEGGTKVAFIQVSGARNDSDAEKVARAVGNSPLVKTALFGSDPNWGRIICAAGYSGAEFKPRRPGAQDRRHPRVPQRHARAGRHGRAAETDHERARHRHPHQCGRRAGQLPASGLGPEPGLRVHQCGLPLVGGLLKKARLLRCCKRSLIRRTADLDVGPCRRPEGVSPRTGRINPSRT